MIYIRSIGKVLLKVTGLKAWCVLNTTQEAPVAVGLTKRQALNLARAHRALGLRGTFASKGGC